MSTSFWSLSFGGPVGISVGLKSCNDLDSIEDLTQRTLSSDYTYEESDAVNISRQLFLFLDSVKLNPNPRVAVDILKALLRVASRGHTFCPNGDWQGLRSAMGTGFTFHPCISSDHCVKTVVNLMKSTRDETLLLHCLSIVSISLTTTDEALSDSTMKWLSLGVLERLDCLLDESIPKSVRRLSWDLGYILVTRKMSSCHRSMGFELRSEWELSAVRMMLKLFNSFVVTFPAHFPFMPERFYDEVVWPLKNKDMCHGKLSSLLSFQGVSSDKYEKIDRAVGVCIELAIPSAKSTDPEGSTSSSENTSDEGAVAKDATPGAGICFWEPTRRRQPWIGTFNVVAMLKLERLVRMYKSSNADVMSIQNEIGVLFKDTFGRIQSCDAKLLHRNMEVPFKSTVATARCEICRSVVSSILSLLSLKGLSLRRHICRVCGDSVCDDCSRPDEWNDELACNACLDSMRNLGLMRAVRTPSLEFPNDVDGDMDWERRCCSESIPDDLRSWRDSTGGVDEAEYLDHLCSVLDDTRAKK